MIVKIAQKDHANHFSIACFHPCLLTGMKILSICGLTLYNAHRNSVRESMG